MAAVDTSLEPILELVTSALTQVEEAGRQINTYGEEIESDPDQLETIEARIRQLKQICRKYGNRPCKKQLTINKNSRTN
jgi:DNA repair protein RecN (Recombination protein N)